MSLSGPLASGIIRVLLELLPNPASQELLLRGHSSEGELAQSSVSGQQSIINF